MTLGFHIRDLYVNSGSKFEKYFLKPLLCTIPFTEGLNPDYSISKNFCNPAS